MSEKYLKCMYYNFFLEVVDVIAGNDTIEVKMLEIKHLMYDVRELQIDDWVCRKQNRWNQ